VDISGPQSPVEQSLTEENRLRLVLENAPAMVWSCLPDGTSDFCSKSWVNYTGMSEEKTRGGGWMEVFHPDDLEIALAKWKITMEKGEPHEVEARLRRSDGVYRWFLIRSVPLFDEHGRVVRWYGSTTDVEDLKQAERNLAHVNRTLQTLY